MAAIAHELPKSCFLSSIYCCGRHNVMLNVFPQIYLLLFSIHWTLPAQCHVISLSTNISFFLTFFLNSLVAGTQWLHLAPVASLIHHWNEYFCKHQDDVKVVATLYGSISLIHHCNEFFCPHPHQQTTR